MWFTVKVDVFYCLLFGSFVRREGAPRQFLYVNLIDFFFWLTIVNHNAGLLYQFVFPLDLVLLAIALLFVGLATDQLPAQTKDSYSFLLSFAVINCCASYFKEYYDRLTYALNEENKIVEARANSLLDEMLPQQMLEELKNDELKLAYEHSDMTFLFADICGFTSWAKSVEAQQVVEVLTKLFSLFDKETTHIGVYKVCTIGDAYVAITQPNTASPAHEGADRMFSMAHAMIQHIAHVRDRLQIPGLNMRIGMHFGKCVGGVIGSQRLRYDIWGLDVLTGNAMESNGVPGKICVSDALKKFVMKDKQFSGSVSHYWILLNDGRNAVRKREIGKLVH